MVDPVAVGKFTSFYNYYHNVFTCEILDILIIVYTNPTNHSSQHLEQNVESEGMHHLDHLQNKTHRIVINDIYQNHYINKMLLLSYFNFIYSCFIFFNACMIIIYKNYHRILSK